MTTPLASCPDRPAHHTGPLRQQGPRWRVGLVCPLFVCVLCTVPIAAQEGDTIKAINLAKVNTEADENDPFQAADGNLYYASNKSGRWEIMVAKKGPSTAFGAGKVFQASKEADYRCPLDQKSVV